MHKKFDINRTKIKGGCQSGRKVVAHDSKRDLPLCMFISSSKFNTRDMCTTLLVVKPIQLG